jgi:hypothetical protein
MNVIHHTEAANLKASFHHSFVSKPLLLCSGIYLIRNQEPQFSGLFTASLGVVNLLLAYLFLNNRSR